MQYISKILLIIGVSLIGQYALAQPPARLRAAAENNASAANHVPLSQRAMNQFPTTITPNEVVWKRDLYRTLDLTKEKNASLYYPVEPTGGAMNLFSYVFSLLLNNQIKAYTYNLDGNETFTPENVISTKDILDKFGIYYEEKNGKYLVNNSDMPSAEVLSYYIKESNFYDQKSATYSSRVTAICPVMHRNDGADFSAMVTKYPMFWLNFDEVSPYLGGQTIMSSSYNNAANMTLNDYFIKNLYQGEIYKTVNLRNQSLDQYCETPDAVKKERENIEQQLSDFKNNLWQGRKEIVDSTQIAAQDSIVESTKKISVKNNTSSTKKSSTKVKKSSSSSSGSSGGGSGAARVSVRRTRR